MCDIEKAMTMDVSFVVLSPVQKTQSHPNTTPIGWDDFSKITQNYSIPIYLSHESFIDLIVL